MPTELEKAAEAVKIAFAKREAAHRSVVEAEAAMETAEAAYKQAGIDLHQAERRLYVVAKGNLRAD